ncbi:stage IV sporulation protein B [Candidatus Arthromitus sp. SFB-mouse-Japan]|uniref:SpoIVB peptidase n=1 Tax=unclassified Candidatus Neoarthromitus TaxID=2638829 RepID=UPI00021B805E|nr:MULTISPECIES: SpoIVB peptidase [unclassified Candidatus Arthromitus]AID44608.1 Stage IV sporulation protein B [Candidatus Arthromitus sp. SFB-mouse-NL]EIA24392.1 Stage IV sporulation protein B [Candidatus Arthromitus sp. SFB-2]BAK56437.1 stage IV sporulation protein B [Candidatus Arthromitus sp. SFB-mouse-Japan]BAK79762.1 stage IV sporulation protein B [Candidatus Arthromitus sp. SFB-mouse-Yit]
MRIKKFLKIFAVFTPILVLFLYISSVLVSIPEVVFLRDGNNLKSNKGIINYTLDKIYDNIAEYNAEFLGFKIRTVEVMAISKEVELYPGGHIVGIKLRTNGPLIVGFSDIENDLQKPYSPSKDGGLNVGDIILSINDIEINSSELLSETLNSLDADELDIKVERDEKIIVKKIHPIKSVDGKNKIGLWVRDSTAGIGTVTFIDPVTGIYGALGHPITDVDTGDIIKISKGNIVSSSIVNVKRGEKGNPGELKGVFINDDINLGSVEQNTKFGIFGKYSLENIYTEKLKIALKDEIQEGPAQIISTVDNGEPKLYDVVIEKLLQQDNPSSKSMIIKVVDEDLLKKTGGIVQGMSGSPIIQNNKIVGAVTHVLVNKPDTGYGIYIEWMLKESKIFD